MAKSIVKKKAFDPSKYVNIETGETLSSEHDGTVSSINISDGSLVKLRSEEFIIKDLKTMDYLKRVLKKSDISYVNLMIDMVFGGYNMLYDRIYFSPHTNKSLQRELELANTAFYALINRLCKKGVLYYLSGYKNRRAVKYILLNPTIARKTNQLQRECLENFEDLSIHGKTLRT